MFTNEEQKRITLIDSQHVTGNLGLLILEACRLRDAGVGAAEICSHIENLIPKVRLYALVQSLKYLRLGGRVSGSAAAVGNLLSISPIITTVNGSIVVAGKIRRSNNAFRKWLRDKLLTDMPDPQYPAVYLHSNNPALTQPLKEEFRYLFPPATSLSLPIGAVVGTHAGPGAVGLCYISRGE